MRRKSQQPTASILRSPSDLAIDPTSSILYVADRAMNGVYPVQGDGSLGLARQYSEWPAIPKSTHGIDFDGAGNLYVADAKFNHVRRVNPDGRQTYMSPPSAVSDFFENAPPAVTRPVAVAVEADGAVLVTALYGDRVWRCREGAEPEVVAGNGRRGLAGDGGPATEAELFSPRSVAVGQDGRIYVAEKFGNRIRVIDDQGHIHTAAGDGRRGNGGDGQAGPTASLAGPEGVAVDPEGRVWIADTGNHRIRVLNPDGVIAPAAGTGEPGRSEGASPAIKAYLRAPRALVVDGRGRVYVADAGNRRICVIEPDGVLQTMSE